MQPAMNTSLRFREIQRLRNRRFKDLHLSRDHNRALSSKSAGFYFRHHNTVIPNRINFSVLKLTHDLEGVNISRRGHNLSRQLHLDSQQMSRHHGILPAAYKTHREDKNTHRQKWNRKRVKRKIRLKPSRESEAEYTGTDQITNESEIKTKINRLEKIEAEVNEMLKTYEDELGTFVHHRKTETNDTGIENINISHLIQTECVYRKLCVKLRQLIAGFSRHNMPWRKNQSNAAFPPNKAKSFLEVLESIRKRRSDLIDHSSKIIDDEIPKKTTFFGWFTNKLDGNTSDGKGTSKNDSIKHLDELTAHTSPEFAATVQLYDILLKSYSLWSDRIKKKDVRSEMEQIIESMRYNFRQGNPNVKPDRQIYHRLMNIYQGTGSLADAKKAVDLLDEMLANSDEGAARDEVGSCRPTSLTYKTVISSFHGIGSNLDAKSHAISLAEDVLNKIETRADVKEEVDGAGISEEENVIRPHTCDPYHAMLLNLIAAGPKGIANYSHRVDSLMEKMIGRTAYKRLLCDDNSLIRKQTIACDFVPVIDTSRIHHLFIHDLIYAFSIICERSEVEKSKILLKKMEDTRKAALDQSSISWDSNYPRSNSFSTVITGLLHSTFDSESEIAKRDEQHSPTNFSTYDDAVYATGLLDSMLSRGSSKKDIYSYYRLIRLWGATQSKEAGRRGEEILSRLEIFAAINEDRKSLKDINLSSKQVALQCWSVAASAGEPGAARCASNLLYRFDERISDLTNKDDDGKREKRFFYEAVIQACAATCVESDKAEALEIAFELYNKMLDEDIPPTSFTFVQLLKCCRLIDPSAHEQALKLSREIFQAACSHGVVTRQLLYRLKPVNYHLYEAYERKPEHSLNVKKSSFDE